MDSAKSYNTVYLSKYTHYLTHLLGGAASIILSLSMVCDHPTHQLGDSGPRRCTLY